MQHNLKSVVGAMFAVTIIVAALWIWRRADAMTSDAQIWAMRSVSLALAAGAQIIAMAAISAASIGKDRMLRALSLAAAGVCGICTVSAAALGLAGR